MWAGLSPPGGVGRTNTDEHGRATDPTRTRERWRRSFLSLLVRVCPCSSVLPLRAFPPHQLHQRLHVPRLREQVEEDEALDPVGLLEGAQVAGQGGGVAGDV